MIRWSTHKIFSLALFFFILVSLGLAQPAPKIGVVNSQQVLESSVEGKKVITQLEAKDKSYQEELARRDEDIRKLQTKLNTQRLTLTPEALTSISLDIERKQTDRKRYAEDSYRDMQELTQRLFQKIQNELLPIIQEVGKEQGLDIIFDLGKSGAIYWNPAIDVTQEVIKRYDASKASAK